MIKLALLLFMAASFCFASGPTGYTFCANENQTCSFTGTMSVAYGANGLFNYKTLTGGTPCTNTVFGDPNVGTTKACYIATATTTTSTTTIKHLVGPFGSNDTGPAQPVVVGATYNLPMDFGCSKFLGWTMHTSNGTGSIDLLYKGVSITGGHPPSVASNTDAYAVGPLAWAPVAAEHLPLTFVVTSVSGGTTEANVVVACQQQ